MHAWTRAQGKTALRTRSRLMRQQKRFQLFPRATAHLNKLKAAAEQGLISADSLAHCVWVCKLRNFKGPLFVEECKSCLLKPSKQACAALRHVVSG